MLIQDNGGANFVDTWMVKHEMVIYGHSGLNGRHLEPFLQLFHPRCNLEREFISFPGQGSRGYPFPVSLQGYHAC
jgi:hypothetical protein